MELSNRYIAWMDGNKTILLSSHASQAHLFEPNLLGSNYNNLLNLNTYLLRLLYFDRMQNGSIVDNAQIDATNHLCCCGCGAFSFSLNAASERFLHFQYQWPQNEITSAVGRAEKKTFYCVYTSLNTRRHIIRAEKVWPFIRMMREAYEYLHSQIVGVWCDANVAVPLNRWQAVQCAACPINNGLWLLLFQCSRFDACRYFRLGCRSYFAPQDWLMTMTLTDLLLLIRDICADVMSFARVAAFVTVLCFTATSIQFDAGPAEQVQRRQEAKVKAKRNRKNRRCMCAK